jgi:hypothetical protein
LDPSGDHTGVLLPIPSKVNRVGMLGIQIENPDIATDHACQALAIGRELNFGELGRPAGRAQRLAQAIKPGEPEAASGSGAVSQDAIAGNLESGDAQDGSSDTLAVRDRIDNRCGLAR